jgi:dTDP-4-amino-4,6-dideoxygalactose transaminase
MTIPFLDLAAQYRSIRSEIDSAVSSVLESSQFILGREVKAFEEEFAAWVGSRYAIAVNSGTSALHLALLAAGVGPGDEVITVPFTFVATVAAIVYTGAKPVFVDIDPVTFTMNPDQLKGALTERTRAIMPVHLYGHPADMDPIVAFAREHKLAIIEDSAQAHGAEYKGKRVGSIGEMGCFSFYPGKNLGAYGEGGAVTTDDPAFARHMRMLRDWGAERKYYHELKGFNYRMEGIQGAVLKVKMKYIDEWTELRRRHATQYSELLSGLDIGLPQTMSWARHVWHVYGIRAKDRESLQALLQQNGVQTNIHYPFPVHLLLGYADLGYSKGDFPHSEAAAAEELSLPMFPELSSGQIDTVCQSVEEACNAVRC